MVQNHHPQNNPAQNIKRSFPPASAKPVTSDILKGASKKLQRFQPKRKGRRKGRRKGKSILERKQDLKSTLKWSKNCFAGSMLH